MKQKNHFWGTDTLLMLLASACIVMGVFLVAAKPIMLVPVGIIILSLIMLIWIMAGKLRTDIRRILNSEGSVSGAGQSGLQELSLPVAIVNEKLLVWYNPAFKQEITQGEDYILKPLHQILPGFDLRTSAMPEGQDLDLGADKYTVYSNAAGLEHQYYFIVLVENTALKHNAAEYLAGRPSVLYIAIDTYDEILKEMKDTERAAIISGIDRALEQYISKGGGMLRKISSSRYLAVVQERQIQDIISARFDILDKVRKSEEESAAPVTLSIGVGRLGASFKECEEWALQALDMALGRGGDQAAVKKLEGFEFYGGVSRSVEKRTKVKSRILAKAIRDLVEQYDRVLIMGHRDSDMDCVGAAIGMWRFCKIAGKQANIVINEKRTLAGSMLKQLKEGGYGGVMMSPEDALPLTGSKTLLIVVDTHMKHLLESQEIYANCGGVVVIDHHRRMVGHIDNAIIFYHEPYASSASELVSELLQYVGDNKDEKPTPLEAEALLAGIMLDTRTFSLHVGVRTFEAAAYLRRMGAQTAESKKLFASSMDDYLYRSHLVANAKVFMGCAVVVSDSVPLEHEVVAPQAANDLLTIEGVEASIVAILAGEQIRISARSMGEVNVQLIMEKLGGGGHLTMAGAQLKGVTIEEAEKMIYTAIEEFRKESKQPQESM